MRLNMVQIISLFAQVSSISSQIDSMTPMDKIEKIETIISSLEQFDLVRSIISDFHTIERQEIRTTIKVLTELDCLSEDVTVKLANRMDDIQKEIENGIVGKMTDRIPLLRSLLGMSEPTSQPSGLLQVLLGGF